MSAILPTDPPPPFYFSATQIMCGLGDHYSSVLFHLHLYHCNGLAFHFPPTFSITPSGSLFCQNLSQNVTHGDENMKNVCEPSAKAEEMTKVTLVFLQCIIWSYL